MIMSRLTAKLTLRIVNVKVLLLPRGWLIAMVRAFLFLNEGGLGGIRWLLRA